MLRPAVLKQGQTAADDQLSLSVCQFMQTIPRRIAPSCLSFLITSGPHRSQDDSCPDTSLSSRRSCRMLTNVAALPPSHKQSASIWNLRLPCCELDHVPLRPRCPPTAPPNHRLLFSFQLAWQDFCSTRRFMQQSRRVVMYRTSCVAGTTGRRVVACTTGCVRSHCSY